MLPGLRRVEDIFQKIGCDTPAVKELLGTDGVTDTNIMAYLGIMEQRTNELLQVRMRQGLFMTGSGGLVIVTPAELDGGSVTLLV